MIASHKGFGDENSCENNEFSSPGNSAFSPLPEKCYFTRTNLSGSGTETEFLDM